MLVSRGATGAITIFFINRVLRNLDYSRTMKRRLEASLFEILLASASLRLFLGLGNHSTRT
jgi:hypothetical protein